MTSPDYRVAVPPDPPQRVYIECTDQPASYNLNPEKLNCEFEVFEWLPPLIHRQIAKQGASRTQVHRTHFNAPDFHKCFPLCLERQRERILPCNGLGATHVINGTSAISQECGFPRSFYPNTTFSVMPISEIFSAGIATLNEDSSCFH